MSSLSGYLISMISQLWVLTSDVSNSNCITDLQIEKSKIRLITETNSIILQKIVLKELQRLLHEAYSFDFTKMEGLGNDFVVIAISSLRLNASIVKILCDRKLGIGADQLIHLMEPTLHHDGSRSNCQVRVQFFNNDGSIAEICGNGMRAIGLYLKRHTPANPSDIYYVETDVGIKEISVRITDEYDQPYLVTVNMGKPKLQRGCFSPAYVNIDAQISFQYYEVNIGNPHIVIFLDGLDDFNNIPLQTWGSILESHDNFLPSKTNVEFVYELDWVASSPNLCVKVWERGAGATLACGTGACAVAVAYLTKIHSSSPRCVELTKIRVCQPGGDLHVSWEYSEETDAHCYHDVFMSGTASEVFQGKVSNELAGRLVRCVLKI